jgi:hypothetical protein
VRGLDSDSLRNFGIVTDRESHYVQHACFHRLEADLFGVHLQLALIAAIRHVDRSRLGQKCLCLCAYRFCSFLHD